MRSASEAFRLQPVKSATQWADVVEPIDKENISSAATLQTEVVYGLKSLKKVRRNACQGRVTEIQLIKYKRDCH